MHAVMVAITNSNRRYIPYSSVDDSMADTSQKENSESLSVDCAHVQAAVPMTWTSVSVEAGVGQSQKVVRCGIARELMEQSLCQVGNHRALHAPETGKSRAEVRDAVLRGSHDAFETNKRGSAHDVGDGVFAQLVKENMFCSVKGPLERATSVKWTRSTIAIGHCTNSFHGCDDVADAKCISGNRELQATVTSADGINVAELAKALRNLVHVVGRDVITLGDLGSADRFSVADSSEINQQAQRKIGVEGKAH